MKVSVLQKTTPVQLALRSASHLCSIGMIATHIIGARARWFHHLLGEGDPEIALLAEWNRDNQPTG